jgi:hypothetical protein
VPWRHAAACPSICWRSRGRGCGSKDHERSWKIIKDHETTLLSSFFIFGLMLFVYLLVLQIVHAVGQLAGNMFPWPFGICFLWWSTLWCELFASYSSAYGLHRILVQSLHAANSKLSSSGWWLQFANTYKYT